MMNRGGERISSAGISLGGLATAFLIPVFLMSGTASAGTDGLQDNGTGILWVNAGEGQTDDTANPNAGTGSIHNLGKSGLSDWVSMLAGLGFESDQVLEGDVTLNRTLLGPYQYTVFSFNMRTFNAGEAAELAEWVRDGGRALFFTGFAFGHADIAADNSLISQFGIQFGDPAQVRLLELVDFVPHTITQGVSLVQSDVGDYLAVGPGTTVLARYAGRPAVAIAEHGEGEVIAFYDCNCFFNGVYDVWDLPCIHDADNAVFAVNIFTYLRWGAPNLEPETSVKYWEVYR